jgi:hypothetical protein
MIALSTFGGKRLFDLMKRAVVGCLRRYFLNAGMHRFNSYGTGKIPKECKFPTEETERTVLFSRYRTSATGAL